MTLIPDIQKVKKVPPVPIIPASVRPSPTLAASERTSAQKKTIREKNKRLTGRWRQFFRRWKKVLIAILIIGSVLMSWSAVHAKRLYTAAQGTKAEFHLTKQALDGEDYAAAARHLGKANEYLAKAQRASRGLVVVKWLPVIRTQFKVIDTLIAVSRHVTVAGQDILPMVGQIQDTLGDDTVSVDSISGEERRALLQAISESPDQLANAQTELEAAIILLEQLPAKGVLGPLHDIVVVLQTQLPQFRTAVNKGLPFLKVAPTVLGYPNEQTYLFLLQNNTELRPTGGFIGTYGILRLNNGDIQEFKTDNIYNIDNPVKDELHIAPPEPITRFLGSTQWFLRDSNWHPDFPISAQKAEEFYHLEHGPVKNIDGVIAVTPVLIHDLLGVTGPITIDGDEYTSDNMTEKLQYEVEVGFRQEGISDAGRKAVIGKLANEIMQHVLRLPKSDWPKLVEVLLQNLEEKHMLLYSKNEAVQTLVRDIGWDGSLRQTDGDFVMVVDTNLAALKTDRVMTKHLEYTVTPDGESAIAELTLRYYNDGQFDFFTTRYRTYTRIYVPAGSEFISGTGWLTNDRYLGGEPATPEISFDQAVNKTVLAGFISVEPKTEEVVTITYRLPPAVIDASASGYRLYIQKQPGTDNVDMTATIQTPQSIESIVPLDGLEQIDNNKVHFTLPLSTDQSVELMY